MNHRLILLRHGQSIWNLENPFTGWTDVGLTEKGKEEAKNAGVLMVEEGLRPDALHTSVLTRAIETAHLALETAGWPDMPTERSWRLNERHYGALQGLDKAATSEKYGVEQVKAWRRSYDVRPPPLDESDERHPIHDPRYADVDPRDLPATECLADVVKRMLPYWVDEVVPQLHKRLTPLLVAHGNSLRALVMELDGLSKEEIVALNIPTGIPLVYELDHELKPVSHRYLGDPGAAEAAAAAVSKQAG